MRFKATARKIFKYVGYPVFFLACFYLFTILTFPVERLAPGLEVLAGQMLGRKVYIGGASLSLGGGLVFTGVEIEVPEKEDPPRAPGRRGSWELDDDDDDDDDDVEDGEGQEAGEQPRPSYRLERVSVDIGLLALLFDKLDLRVSFDGLGGTVRFAYAGPKPEERSGRPVAPRGRPAGRGAIPGAPGSGPPGSEQQHGRQIVTGDDGGKGTGMRVTVEARGLELGRLHDIRSKVPLPLSGRLDLEVSLASPTGSFSDAEGEMTMRLTDMALGTADYQIDVGGMPLTIDPISVAAIECLVSVREGTAEFEIFDAESEDFDIQIMGTVALADSLSRSRFDVYLMFRFLDGYLDKSDRAQMLVSNINQFSREFKRAQRDDGYWGFRYRGMPGTGRFTPSKLAPGEQAKGAKGRRAVERKRGARPVRAPAAAPAVNLPTGPVDLAEPTAGRETGTAVEPEIVPPPERPAPVREPIPPLELRPHREMEHGEVEHGEMEADEIQDEESEEHDRDEEAEYVEIQDEEGPGDGERDEADAM